MSKYLWIFFIIFAVFLQNCSDKSNAEPSEKNTGTPVKVQTIKTENFSEYLNLTGTVKARNQIKIISEESGIVNKIIRNKGQYIKKGQALAVLENNILKAAYDEAKASLEQAKLDYKSSEVLYEKKALSDNQFMSSKLALDRAQAAFDMAKTRYEKLTITAPIKGFVNARYFDMGAYISHGTQMFEIVDSERLKVTTGVAERFRRFIQVGSKAVLTFDAFPDLEIESKITFVSKSINPLNRTFAIETEFDNPQGKLSPEMISNIRLLKRSVDQGIVLPIDALIDSEDGRYVFVEENSVAIKKNLDILAVQGDKVLVNGVDQGAQLVILGHRELSDGDTLNIIND